MPVLRVRFVPLQLGLYWPTPGGPVVACGPLLWAYELIEVSLVGVLEVVIALC